MEIKIQREHERGKRDHGWLKANHSFSFGDYINYDNMGFGKLRVLNDDTIAAGKGFPPHPHSNMEIITIVTEGELAHEDSMGKKEVLHKGDIQVMSAGKGLFHSEYNNSKEKELKLFQIWIETEKENIEPRHDSTRFKIEDNQTKKIVSKNDEKTLHINQDAAIYKTKYNKDTSYTHNIDNNKGTYIMVINGKIQIEKNTLSKRDAIQITKTSEITINHKDNSEYIIIEVPL